MSMSSAGPDSTVDPSRFGIHPLRRETRGQPWNARTLRDFAFLTCEASVPESDSGPCEKRYCCAGAETPHELASKLAPVPRKADG